MRLLVGVTFVLVIGSNAVFVSSATNTCFVSAIAVSLQTQAIPKDGLVSRWKFDETSGAVAYDWFGENDGSLHGCSWAPGEYGGSLALNGLTDYVEVRDDPSLDMTTEITIMGWVYYARNANCVILCKQPTNPIRSNYPGNYEFTITVGGPLRFGYETGVGDYLFMFYESVPALSPGVWHHVGVTLKKGGNVVFYIDGQEAGTFPQQGRFGSVNHEPVRIGTRKEFPNFFCGYMDELCLYRRALSTEEIQMACTPVPGDVYYVDRAAGDNRNDGRKPNRAFATIQMGIDAARDNDVVLVYPGIYSGPISFKGKAITVRSVEDAAIIECPGLSCVTFSGSEGPRSVLKNFIIRNSQNGILVTGGMPTLKNLTITSCWTGIKALGGLPGVDNCILWGNTDADLVGCGARYSCVQKGYLAVGNTSADPLFATPQSGDYHLSSTAGTYSSSFGTWIRSDENSPCIDAGDPEDDCSAEPKPNGGRIDMGAHGGTPYASMSVVK
jgi:hypothetical protein